jgi:uncharacterized sporulation protein YeaH/YhbH (DUF444 family)
MGIERAVTRWYVQRQALSYEIEKLSEQLERAQAREQQNGGEEAQSLRQRLAEVERRLKALGNCPKPMMG